MQPLTEKQKQMLDYIEQKLTSGRPPSQREIARHFRLSQNAVCQLVRYLKKKGYLADTTGHRGLRLSDQYRLHLESKTGIPLVGRVAAGRPILAEENIEDYLDLNKMFTDSDNTFFLKVTGDSMVDLGICDGDYVAVKPDPNPRTGRIAVVLIDDEATVKQIHIQRNRIALKPANRAAGYKTTYIKRTDENARIIGRVTGCFRKME